MPVTSMPRPTTSVATSTGMVPSRKPCMTRLRVVWGRSPWMVETPLTCRPSLSASLSAPPLGAGEDDALARPLALEQVDQEVELAVVLDGDVILLDRLDRRLVARQVL